MPVPLPMYVPQMAHKYGAKIKSALGFGRGGGDDDLDWDELQRMSGSLKPTGYTTPEDLAAAEMTKGRLRKGASASAAGLRVEAMRRARQRGMDTAPAMEATLGRIGEAEAVGHERAGETAEEQLFNTRLGRERFEQSKALTILGGKLQDAGYARQSRSLRRTAFLNSLLSLSQASLAAMGNGGLEAASGGAVNEGVPGEAWG